jgi:hypothetical protein
MTGKEFMRAVSNGRIDLLQLLLDALAKVKSAYCVIGGLAVNAYAEPVVSLDLDIIVATENLEKLLEVLAPQELKAKQYEHSVNLSSPQSDLRIQIQTDKRYQEFIPRAQDMKVLGYAMKVAAIEDVLQGKLWAYQDQTRRQSKRQKDLADIVRLVETRPSLEELLPAAVREQVTMEN